LRADCYGPAEFAAPGSWASDGRNVSRRGSPVRTASDPPVASAENIGSGARQGVNCTVPQFLDSSCLESLRPTSLRLFGGLLG
jgi:hypothetical protein